MLTETKVLWSGLLPRVRMEMVAVTVKVSTWRALRVPRSLVGLLWRHERYQGRSSAPTGLHKVGILPVARVNAKCSGL